MAKYIKYIGTSHWRAITEKDWVKAGVRGQDTLLWDRSNNWCVPLSKVTEDALPFIDADQEMVILEGLEGTTPDRGGDQIWPKSMTGYLSTFGVPVNVNGDYVNVVDLSNIPDMNADERAAYVRAQQEMEEPTDLATVEGENDDKYDEVAVKDETPLNLGGPGTKP